MRSTRLSANAKILLLVVGLAALYGGWFAGQHYARLRFEPQVVSLFDTRLPLQPATLTDHHGARIDPATLANWRIIAPVSLTETSELNDLLRRLSRLHNRLAGAPELQREIRYLLVAVGDSPNASPRLAARLTGYSRNLLGVSGEPAALQAFTQQPALQPKVTRESGAPLRFADGGTLVLIAPDGTAVGEFPRLFDPVTMADELIKMHHFSR